MSCINDKIVFLLGCEVVSNALTIDGWLTPFWRNTLSLINYLYCINIAKQSMCDV